MRNELIVVALALCGCGDEPFVAADTRTIVNDTAEDARAEQTGQETDAPIARGDDGGADAHEAGELDTSAPDTGAIDAAPDTWDGCAPTAHDNGMGQHWTDCAPLATYSLAQARAACAAFTGDPGACGPLNVGGVLLECSNGVGQPVCACWEYVGAHAGEVNHGQDGCEPPGANLGTDSKWK